MNGIFKKSGPSWGQNSRIHIVEERAEIKSNATDRIFNKISKENFSNLEKDIDIQSQEVCGIPDISREETLHSTS